MPSVVATVKVKEEKIEDAKAFLKGLADEVLANEPGTLAYVVHQRQDDPQSFVVYEKYESNEAFAIHGKNLAAKGAEFGALMAAAPEIVMMDEL
jgi:quinol monooxygenase YgiN